MIGEWCTLCVVADLAAIAHAVLIVTAGVAWPSPGRRAIAVTAVLAVAAVALPLAGLSSSKATVPVTAAAPTVGAPGLAGQRLPEVVAREQAEGKVVVIDFIDFQCPHCRAMHPRLVEALGRSTPRSAWCAR